jgi:hypothetical protein
MRLAKPFCTALLTLLLGGCDVRSEPTTLAALTATRPAQPLLVPSSVHVSLGTGYSRTIDRGSTWLPVGEITAGTVYKRKDGVFTVEGTNVHEAYLVVANGRLMGFYLAAEGAYAPLDHPIDLSSH